MLLCLPASRNHIVMPRGPKGEKRRADVIGAAVMIGKIATGEIEDLTTEEGKNAAAVALGRMGGRRGPRACQPNGGKRSPRRRLRAGAGSIGPAAIAVGVSAAKRFLTSPIGGSTGKFSGKVAPSFCIVWRTSAPIR